VHASKRILQSLFAFGLMFMLACGPSSKGETQQWDLNKASITELGAKWPGFQALLDARLAEAQPAWDAALAESDEEKKAKAMEAANELFNPLLGKLKEVQSKSDGIDSAIEKINKLKLDKTKDRKRGEAVGTALEVVSGVEAALAAGTPADDAAAVAIADEQISALISGNGAIDRAHDAVKPKKASKTKLRSKK
jgi:hypothetical protein